MPGHHCGRVIHQTSRQHRSFAMKRARGSDYLLLGGCWGIQMAGSWQLNSLKRNAGWLPLSGKCWQALSLNTVMTERTGRQGTEGSFLTDSSFYYSMCFVLFFLFARVHYFISRCTFCIHILYICAFLIHEELEHTHCNIPWLIDPVTVILQYYIHWKMCEPVQHAWALVCACLCRIDVLTDWDAISELIFSSRSLREEGVCHVDRQLIFQYKHSQDAWPYCEHSPGTMRREVLCRLWRSMVSPTHCLPPLSDDVFHTLVLYMGCSCHSVWLCNKPHSQKL